MAKAKGHKKKSLAIGLTPENYAALNEQTMLTRHSMSQLCNIAIDFTRKKGGFDTLDINEPKTVQKARLLLERWKTPTKARALKAASRKAKIDKKLVIQQEEY